MTASRTPPPPNAPEATQTATGAERAAAEASPERGARAPSCSVIIHAQLWPDAQTTARLRARVHEAWPDAELIEAREQPSAALGAAAAINQAVAQSRGAILIALEPDRLPTIDSLRALSPDECELEFGVKLAGEAGAVIARTSAEGHFTVKLSWARDPTPDAD